jgi:selenocysteine lyase/cysteine desulfurase
MSSVTLPVALVGDGLRVPCVDGAERPYVSFDAAASTSALPQVMDAVEAFVPRYAGVHHGTGYKSQASALAFASAHRAALAFAGRDRDSDDVAIICRNTTEAINHLAYRLRVGVGDVVVTTVAEHYSNLLPWVRAAACRFVECGQDGTFGTEDVVAALDQRPTPRLLAITGASNVTGWLPPLPDIIAAAHHRGIPVLVDAAQFAPHRPLPREADFLAWSGHKMYAPFGTGVLVGPRRVFMTGDPFLVGGGAAAMPGLGEVTWLDPPEREEAGSPNVIGAVALHAAIGALEAIGWPAITGHDRRIAASLRRGLAAIPAVRLLGPGPGTETLPVATFTVDGVPGALVAARLAAEEAIGVRYGSFYAGPYLTRLLGLSPARAGDDGHGAMPGAVRASAGINTSEQDVARLLAAIARVVASDPPVRYLRDPLTSEFHPDVPSAAGSWLPPRLYTSQFTGGARGSGLTGAGDDTAGSLPHRRAPARPGFAPAVR